MILLLKQRVKCANQEILFIIIYDILHSFPQIQYSVYNGTESASYFGPKIPAKIKNKDSLDGFKRKIQKWDPVECQCRICRTFVPNLGFI